MPGTVLPGFLPGFYSPCSGSFQVLTRADVDSSKSKGAYSGGKNVTWIILWEKEVEKLVQNT